MDIAPSVTFYLNEYATESFTYLLENRVTLTGAGEGNPANNQTYPIRVGAVLLKNPVYLPVIRR